MDAHAIVSSIGKVIKALFNKVFLEQQHWAQKQFTIRLTHAKDAHGGLTKGNIAKKSDIATFSQVGP